jgi:hypothetical protein
MTSSSILSAPEQFWLVALILLFLVDIVRFFYDRDPLAIYQPPVFVAFFMSYYCIFAPLQRLQTGDWFHNLHDFRYGIGFGWSGAAVFYLSLRIGYHLFRSFRPYKRFSSDYNALAAQRFGSTLCIVGLFLFTIVNGPTVIALLTPFSVEQSAFFGSAGLSVGFLANYGNLAINFLIPGILLQFASWIKTRRSFLGWSFWLLIALAIYTSLGFRWRIIVLVLSLILLWFFARARRPSLVVLSITLISLLLFAAFVEQTRTYGKGLSLSKASGLSASTLIESGSQEGSVFLISGALIASSPSSTPFVGLQPIISTILFPIPSAIWRDKDSYMYLFRSISNLFRSPAYAIGQAVLNYSEYYLMFGWPSLVLMGLLSGFLLRCLWNWFTARRHEVLAQVAYICTCSLLYMWISRGYLPQFILTLAFGSFPLFLYYYRHSYSISASAQDIAKSVRI